MRAEPAEARRLLLALSDVLQRALRAGDFVTLESELRHVEAYLALEQARLGERLRVEIDVPSELREIELAQAQGMNVHADQYPYTAGSTILRAVLQNGAFSPAHSGNAGIAAARPADVVLASAPGHPEWEGLSIEQLSESLGMGPREAAEHVAEAARGATVVLHMMSEEDVQTVLRHPSTMIGSDGFPLKDGKPHPRTYGTYPRVLERYVRELGLLSLESAVHRMTGMVATKLGMSQRGVLREGARADLVLFDPEGITDRATYRDPKNPPLGIEHVFVGGEHTVKDGEHTGARAGRVLAKNKGD